MIPRETPSSLRKLVSPTGRFAAVLPQAANRDNHHWMISVSISGRHSLCEVVTTRREQSALDELSNVRLSRARGLMMIQLSACRSSNRIRTHPEFHPNPIPIRGYVLQIEIELAPIRKFADCTTQKHILLRLRNENAKDSNREDLFRRSLKKKHCGSCMEKL